MKTLDTILDLKHQADQARTEYMRLLNERDKLIQQEIKNGTSMYRIAQHIGVNGETVRKIRDKKTTQKRTLMTDLPGYGSANYCGNCYSITHTSNQCDDEGDDND